MKKKISAELAAERGELLGEPYTPPGRTAVFDIPAYDDIADLHELFKRFANTAAGVSEAGLGGLVDKTADFTVTTNDLGKTYVCNRSDLMNVTVGAASGFQEGARFNIVQAGSGKVQVVGSDVIGASRTTGQYEGLTAVVHGGKWWCLPFGSSSGGGGGGPIQIVDTAADLTVNASHMGALIACDTSTKAISITLPADDGSIPVGAAIVISNVGAGANKAKVVGASGVVVQDRAAASVGRYQSVSVVKRALNTWLISAGGGSTGGSVPTQPQNAKAYGTPGSILVTWETPADDGGHSITSYIVEHGESADALTQQKIVAGDQLTALVEGLTVGKAHFARVKAVNSVGASEPSAVVSATPASDYNDATGGTETTYEKNGRVYRVHTFTGENTLTVKKAAGPFRVLVLGQGGGGGSTANNMGGGGGGGGACVDTLLTLTAKAYPVKVGAPSSFDTITANAGENGHSGWNEGAESGKGGNAGNGNPGSYAQGLLPAGGGGGGAGAGTGGQGGGQGIFSDITGETKEYGRGGDGGAQHYPGNPAGPALVIVSYEIAPFNNATGGETTEIDNYLGTGETWRLHTFKSNSTLSVKAAFQPFRVLAVGAGAGGGYGGAGGHGQLVENTKVTLAAIDYAVTVGAGGFPYSGGDNHDAPGGDGGPSSLGSMVVAAGGVSRGPETGEGAKSLITGSEQQYGGAGGRKVINDNTTYPGSPRGGGATAESGSYYGAGGGGQQLGTAGTGYQGLVIVAYRIK